MRLHDLTGTETRPAYGSYTYLVNDLLAAPVVHTGEWQAMDTTASKVHATHELEDITIIFEPLPRDLDVVVPAIDHAWADAHFLERVSGNPLNPAPSHVDWPYAWRNNTEHTKHSVFDHTYPERFWPKHAGLGNAPVLPVFEGNHHRGVRFPYGDLNDLVDMLVRNPLTRQAYLPVWFPEDTGAVDGQRVPCTLGYHFSIRDNKLSCRYYLRSCDIYRHFSNDVYLAAMLQQWVAREVNQRTIERLAVPPSTGAKDWRPVTPHKLVMHIANLHAFVGDERVIKQRLADLP